MLRIFKRLEAKEWGFVFISLIFVVLQVWLDLTMPEYMGKITTLVQTPGSEMSEIISAGAMMLLCSLGSLASSIIVAGFAAKIAANFSARLRGMTFDKVQSFTMEEINTFSIASLITRSTNDITQVQTLVVMGLQIIIKSPILAGWAIVKIMNKSWQWSAATGIGIFVLLIIATVFIAVVLPKFKKLQQQTDELNKISRENLTGIRVVRAYNAEKYQENKFDVANVDLTKTNLFANRMMSILMPSVDMIINGLILSIYWVGALLISSAAMNDKLTLFSDMMVFSSYAIQLLMAFMMLVMMFILLPRASVSAKRINEVLETKPRIVDGRLTQSPENLKGEIEFKNVSFKYPDAQEYVIENISFIAKKGETIAFIGSTGCGKSTVINLIPRFYDATEGEILVDGLNVKEYTQSSLRSKIGYVSQKATLFRGSISSNISFGTTNSGKPVQKDIKNAIEVSQSAEFVETTDKKYDAFVAAGGTNLSGGQKQRLSIARAIARNPEFLIFDDSFSALDYKTDRKLRSELKKAANQCTILIVAQRIGTIKDADKIVVLENGSIVGIGTHSELMKSCEVYSEIAHSQLSKEELE